MQQYIDGTDRVSHAIRLIQEHEPKDGYYVAFSGGKDSQVIYDLVKRAGVRFDAHFHFTTVDPPELLQHIKTHYSDIPWDRPKESMFKIIENKGFPPSRQVRYCCEKLKEIGGKGRTIITGVRWEESAGRSKRQQYEKQGSRHFLNPILDWTSDDVWEYIRTNEIPYCSLYDEGYSRIGCIMCPLQRKKGILMDAERYPKYYRAYMRTFRRTLIKNAERGRECSQKTAEEMMNWWIYGVTDPMFVDILKDRALSDFSDCLGFEYDGISEAVTA